MTFIHRFRPLFALAALLFIGTACSDQELPTALADADLQASAEALRPSLSTSSMAAGQVKLDGGAHHACTFYPQDGNVNCFGVYPLQNTSPRPDGTGWYGERADYMEGDALAFGAGDWNSCALLENGSTKCWGYNATKISYAGTDATQLAVGYGSSCVRTSAGNVHCVGDYVGGAGGAWRQAYSGGDAEWVVMSSYAACIKKQGSNTLTCFGWGVSKPQWTTAGTPTSRAGGHYNVCILLAEGTMECMGSSGHGEGRVPADLAGVRDMDSHYTRTCAVLSNGDIKCWGYNPVNRQSNQTWTHAGVGAVNVTVTYEETCYSTAAGSTACVNTIPDAYSGGAPADSDADGIADVEDNCPAAANADQADLDGDRVGDVCDPDVDGDGVANGSDAFPRDAGESADTDGDGVGDNADAYDRSNTGSALMVGACNPGVANWHIGGGTWANDLIAAAQASAANHGAFVKAVSEIADGWKKSGKITGREQGSIASCAAKTK